MKEKKSSAKVVVVGGAFGQMVDPVLQLMPTGKGLLAAEIADELEYHFSDVSRIGNFPGAEECSFHGLQERMSLIDANIVVFLPHLPNILVRGSEVKIRVDEGETGCLEYRRAPKIVGDIKKQHPEVLLIPFKLADKDTTRIQIVAWMLQIHAALAVYSRIGEKGRYFIIDALGNEKMVMRVDLPSILAGDILLFSKTVRRRSIRVGSGVPKIEYIAQMVAFSRKMRPAFEGIIGVRNVITERWPGNFSFRCAHGFLSHRAGNGFVITRRNVDKTGLSDSDFVWVSSELEDGKIKFWGEENQKPSIDAPIHRVLYNLVPWVQCIVHGHLRIGGEYVSTLRISYWPCGAENEGYDIAELVPQERPSDGLLVVNVQGHGFVALIGDVDPTEALDKLAQLEFETW
ncbi:MAG: class II aldolase/adducin family protein [Candidatus Omnitrophota bacterium]|nr:MAG: class II aldolase/adducin family protein [Candidatus Omnitrophota bacterium]